MADLEKIADEIQGLTLLEAADLVKLLEDKLGVTAAAPMAVAAVAPGAAGAAPEEVEEQTEFDVVLGLKESKELVDGAPSTVLQAVSKEAAEEAKAKLEAEGATVQLT
jgi:large subunit ribosomal protein L7/L12